jgi:hypothetical protein
VGQHEGYPGNGALTIKVQRSAWFPLCRLITCDPPSALAVRVRGTKSGNGRSVVVLLRCLSMVEGQSRVQEYRGRAAILRQLARETRDQDVLERLILLAARFERLADQAEKWQQSGRYNTG